MLLAKARRQCLWEALDSEEETAVVKVSPHALPWWHCVLALMRGGHRLPPQTLRSDSLQVLGLETEKKHRDSEVSAKD